MDLQEIERHGQAGHRGTAGRSRADGGGRIRNRLLLVGDHRRADWTRLQPGGRPGGVPGRVPAAAGAGHFYGGQCCRASEPGTDRREGVRRAVRMGAR